MGFLRPDRGGDLLLAPDGVDGHGGAAQIQQGQQFGDGGDLVRVRLGLDLAEHELVLGGPGTDGVQRGLRGASIMRAARRLAVDRHDLCRGIGLQGQRGHPLRPLRQAGRERVPIQTSEDAVEGVVRGDAVGKREEGAQPWLARAAELGDLGEGVRSAELGQDGNGEEVGERVMLRAINARVGNLGQMSQEALRQPGSRGFTGEHGRTHLRVVVGEIRAGVYARNGPAPQEPCQI